MNTRAGAAAALKKHTHTMNPPHTHTHTHTQSCPPQKKIINPTHARTSSKGMGAPSVRRSSAAVGHAFDASPLRLMAVVVGTTLGGECRLPVPAAATTEASCRRAAARSLLLCERREGCVSPMHQHQSSLSRPPRASQSKRTFAGQAAEPPPAAAAAAPPAAAACCCLLRSFLPRSNSEREEPMDDGGGAEER